ncbi:MAG: HAD-IC family P-type ATPase [Actinoallomurus sp.]
MSLVRPHPAGTANLLLGLLAVLLVGMAVAGAWVAGHPAEVHRAERRVRTWPWWVRLRDRYTGQIEFLVRHFRPGGAYGLSVVVGAAALAAGLFVFGWLLHHVLVHEEIVLLDEPVTRFIARHRVGWLTAVLEAVTWLGNGFAVTVLIVTAGVWLRVATGRWRPMLLLAATAVGAGVLDTLFKVLVARPRPPAGLMLVQAQGYAFPSEHTTQTAVYGALAYLMASRVRGWRRRVTVCAGAVTVAVVLGLSRVYLGVHWLTDVLGGWALAGAWLALVLTVTITIGRLSPGAAVLPARPAAAERSQGWLAPQPTEAEQRAVTGPSGLTSAQVRARLAAGQVNTLRQRTSRSFGQILTANVFTRFNALLGALAMVILWVGPARDALFGLVIVANSAIGIVQEVRAKRVLDRLVLVAARRAHVLRDGAVTQVAVEEVLLDDLVELHAGETVPVDGVALRTDGLEVDESLLSGESEPVPRSVGQEVRAGSVVVAGTGRMQAVRVGQDTFAQRLAAQAREFQLTRSELRAGIDLVLRYVSWALLPVAVLLGIGQLTRAGVGWTDAVRGSVAGVVGMVPEGLVLLTSLAMAAAIIRLGRRDVLVQELAAVEALARADVLCLDKTGTLTDGAITVEQVIPAAAPACAPDPAEALAALAAADPDPNPTMRALARVGGRPSWTPTAGVRFSSARRWSAITFGERGTVLLGAPDVLLTGLPAAKALLAQAHRLAAAGSRVLVLAHSAGPIGPAGDRPALPADRAPLALVVLTEHVRADAPGALRYFVEQGVTLKVISGDDPATVAAVAGRAGVPGAERAVDGRDLPGDETQVSDLASTRTVFGRIDPHQKRTLVAALQRRGRTVAMTGDGVNDVLALKDADLGIALGSGTAASRSVAQLVLLDGQFAALPGVVAEGRRVIANIERTAKLFLTKTVYVMSLAVAVGAAGVPFPFLPRHLTLIAALTIGIPGFFLALAPNASRARPGFIGRVLSFAGPAGAVAAAATLAAYGLARHVAPADTGQARTAATVTLALTGLSVLAALVRRGAGRQRALIPAQLAALALVLAVPPVRTFFALALPTASVWVIIVGIAAVGFAFIALTSRLTAPPEPPTKSGSSCT